MTNLNKLSIKDWEKWFILKILEKTDLTDADLAYILGDKHIAIIQKLQLTKKREAYEKLQPAWFEYAPASAKEKWEEYKNTDNLEKLQWIHDNVSYNADHTMNILKLKKTFCEDVSWTGKNCNWEDAKQLAESKWYTLPTDYNDCDSDEVKQDSDWYKVINIFSNENWDTVEGMKLFRDIAWCNNRYWTSTEYKNDKWEKLEGLARYRILNASYILRSWFTMIYNSRVCGFKKSMK